MISLVLIRHALLFSVKILGKQGDNMSEHKFVRVDGIKWWITENTKGIRYPQPLCPKHDIRLYPVPYSAGTKWGETAMSLSCEEEPHILPIPRNFARERTYVLDKIDSKVFGTKTFVTIDDEVIPVAREKLKDSPYWVDAKVTKSKAGTRLVIWAGNRERKDKTQLFIEPELKKLSFDQNDTHPHEVFTVVEAKFADGSSARISS